jgi:hypothetical protein
MQLLPSARSGRGQTDLSSVSALCRLQERILLVLVAAVAKRMGKLDVFFTTLAAQTLWGLVVVGYRLG